MTDKDAPEVAEETQLHVGGFQGGEGVRGDGGIKVSWVDARVLGEIVNHRLRDVNVVINEGDSLSWAPATHHGDTGESELRRLDDSLGSVRPDFNLLLFCRDELRIQSTEVSTTGYLIWEEWKLLWWKEKVACPSNGSESE